MITITHRPSGIGWEFASQVLSVQGGARSLPESVETSEHAARQYLSRLSGYAVLPDDARHKVEHFAGVEHLAASYEEWSGRRALALG